MHTSDVVGCSLVPSHPPSSPPPSIATHINITIPGIMDCWLARMHMPWLPLVSLFQYEPVCNLIPIAIAQDRKLVFI